MDPYVGEIRMVGFNFAPNGWAFCNGQLMPINQYQVLFSLLGTAFGGNGTTTFGLPNLQGRVPINQGQGIGLSPYVIGQVGGSENVTLLQNQMPAHNHQVNVNNLPGTQANPVGAILAEVNNGDGRQPNLYPAYTTANPNGTMSPNAISLAGGNQPHPNLQPYLCVNFIIALNGIYPSRG